MTPATSPSCGRNRQTPSPPGRKTTSPSARCSSPTPWNAAYAGRKTWNASASLTTAFISTRPASSTGAEPCFSRTCRTPWPTGGTTRKNAGFPMAHSLPHSPVRLPGTAPAGHGGFHPENARLPPQPSGPEPPPGGGNLYVERPAGPSENSPGRSDCP